jgi:hypothetical protein
VLLRDVNLTMAAATAPAIQAAAIAEDRAEYPDPHMFATVMPAYGLWLRHVRHVTLLRVQFTGGAGDPRPMLLAGVDADFSCEAG